MSFVDVGFSNYVEESKIIAISRPDSSPIRRMISKAKEENRYLDLTQGKKTRCVITSSDQKGTVLIGSAVQSVTVINRMKRDRDKNGATTPDVIGEGASE